MGPFIMMAVSVTLGVAGLSLGARFTAWESVVWMLCALGLSALCWRYHELIKRRNL